MSGTTAAGARTAGPWKATKARTLIHISCDGHPVCEVSVSTGHVHEDYPGCKRDYAAKQEAAAAFIVEACNRAALAKTGGAV